MPKKTGQLRILPLNARGLKVHRTWEIHRENEFVFSNYETSLRIVDLKGGFATAYKIAKIAGVSWHTLRHTFVSRPIARGLDIVTVQQRHGHPRVAVTLRCTHTNLDSKVRAVGKLAGDCYNPATPRTKMQQSIPRVSQNGR